MIARFVVPLCGLLLLGAGCQPTTTPVVSSDLTFIADEGIRMENASNPGAKTVGDNVHLLYELQGSNGGGHATAIADETSDWLDFTVATDLDEDQDVFRAHQLPDGTWRTYGLDTTKGIMGTCLKSRLSQDGITYTEEPGCRYSLHSDDNGRMGVYDFFNDADGGVTMLYLGDLQGKNNVRRAYSTDNGYTFTFQNGNALGDDAFGGGPKSYVDQKTIRLSDGTLYLIAMKEGKLYGFTSTDNGENFVSKGVVLTTEDYDLEQSVGLHDPQIIELPDGRYRIYVTISQGDPAKKAIAAQHIVSATSL